MNIEDTHKELLRAIRMGKESAFRAVFISYFESLVIFAKAYVEDEEVARDMVQEVFLKFWQKRTALPEELNLKAYLYQSTKNNCLNYLKNLKVQAKYKKRQMDNYHDLLLNYEALSKLNIDKVSYDELMETINNSIVQLPPRCREIFELSRYDGLKNREIAQKLDISIKAVEGQVSKALKHLKEKLNKDFSGFLLYILLRER